MRYAVFIRWTSLPPLRHFPSFFFLSKCEARGGWQDVNTEDVCILSWWEECRVEWQEKLWLIAVVEDFHVKTRKISYRKRHQSLLSVHVTKPYLLYASSSFRLSRRILMLYSTASSQESWLTNEISSRVGIRYSVCFFIKSPLLEIYSAICLYSILMSVLLCIDNLVYPDIYLRWGVKQERSEDNHSARPNSITRHWTIYSTSYLMHTKHFHNTHWTGSLPPMLLTAFEKIPTPECTPHTCSIISRVNPPEIYLARYSCRIQYKIDVDWQNFPCQDGRWCIILPSANERDYLRWRLRRTAV